jgi:hypothetical protein
MKSICVALVTTASLLAWPALLVWPAAAHHGPIGNPVLYLSENLVEFEGEITDVFWRNPHPRLRMRVVDDGGEETIWELELDGSPISFARKDITADDFAQVGDRVRVAGVVALFENSSLGVLHYQRPDGQEYVFRNRELRWGDEQFAPVDRPLDPAKIAQARQNATGIFRVWGGRSPDGAPPHPPLSSYEQYLTERARELAASYNRATDDGELDCRQGMPTTMFDPVPMEFVDEGERILIRVQEYDVERLIYLNADTNAEEPEHTPLGYSVGHWEGDTLFVTTTHINWAQFDPYGTPQSDQTQLLERFRFNAENETLEYSLTATDPVMFTEPLTFEKSRPWTPGIELQPFNCVARWEDAAN